tara:strand:- start:337 stop:960 length:624 start_codon:yes stop_codon:yes gene_type:complete
MAVTGSSIIGDDGKNTEQGRRSGVRREVSRATPKRLEYVALHYLERYASSSENLRRILLRRVDRSARVHGTDRCEGEAAVEQIIRKFQECGYLNDRVYAEMRVGGLHRRGTSGRAIRHRLALKGVAEDDIEAALEALSEEVPHPDRHAAIAYARRRRIGPWRLDGREKNRERDLAALGRQGFSYEIARWIVEAASPEACEANLLEKT